MYEESVTFSLTTALSPLCKQLSLNLFCWHGGKRCNHHSLPHYFFKISMLCKTHLCYVFCIIIDIINKSEWLFSISPTSCYTPFYFYWPAKMHQLPRSFIFCGSFSKCVATQDGSCQKFTLLGTYLQLPNTGMCAEGVSKVTLFERELMHFCHDEKKMHYSLISLSLVTNRLQYLIIFLSLPNKCKI